jgi:hypothetical protein
MRGKFGHTRDRNVNPPVRVLVESEWPEPIHKLPPKPRD